MKSYSVNIILRPSILDNAGRAVTKALTGQGFPDVIDARIGKTIYFKTDRNPEEFIHYLYNEVMEDYELKCLDDAD